MKHFILYIGVVFGITALIISCSSEDAAKTTTSTTAATTYLTIAGCTDNVTVPLCMGSWENGTRPGSGSGNAENCGNRIISPRNNISTNWAGGDNISDSDNKTVLIDGDLSGTYNLLIDNDTTAGGCITGTSNLSNFGMPASILGVKHQLAVTGNESFSITTRLYTDAACATQVAFYMRSKDNVTIGDNVTLRSEAVSEGGGVTDLGPTMDDKWFGGFPNSATKIRANASRYCIYAGTDDTTTLFNSWSSGSPWTIVKDNITDEIGGNDNGTDYFLIAVKDNVTQTPSAEKERVFYELRQNLYPDNWTVSGSDTADIYFQDNTSSVNATE